MNRQVVTVLLLQVVSSQGAGPAFPPIWSATEAITGRGGSGTLQVWFDQHNQTEVAYNENQKTWFLTDWKANGGQGKVYTLTVYGNPPVRHCKGWCEPTVPEVCDAADSLCQPPYLKSAVNEGQSAVPGSPGVTGDLWKWGDNLGPIPMNELYLWVGTAAEGTSDGLAAGSPVPLEMIRDVHPFGREAGNISITFSDFKALKVVPADLWDLGPDAKYNCMSPEPSSGCNTKARDGFNNPLKGF